VKIDEVVKKHDLIPNPDKKVDRLTPAVSKVEGPSTLIKPSANNYYMK